MIARESKASTEDDRQSFLINSGASKHVCCDTSVFSLLKMSTKESVLLGDERKIEAKEFGSIKMKLKVGK